MDARWCQGLATDRTFGYGIIDYNCILVGFLIIFHIAFAEAFNRLAGVMFVRYCKIRIAGDGLAAIGAPEAHQGAKNRFDKQIHYNQKTPFAVCMQFEKY